HSDTHRPPTTPQIGMRSPSQEGQRYLPPFQRLVDRAAIDKSDCMEVQGPSSFDDRPPPPRCIALRCTVTVTVQTIMRIFCSRNEVHRSCVPTSSLWQTRGPLPAA